MFANCRGIPSNEIAQTVDEAIRNLNLEVHADKLCGSYSGGYRFYKVSKQFCHFVSIEAIPIDKIIMKYIHVSI